MYITPKKYKIIFKEKKYLCPANKKNSMLATSSSIVIFLNKFVFKYLQLTNARLPTFSEPRENKKIERAVGDPNQTLINRKITTF
jgi:hypothetical protein